PRLRARAHGAVLRTAAPARLPGVDRRPAHPGRAGTAAGAPGTGDAVTEADSRVVVTGLGLVSPMGIGVDAFRSGLQRGASTAAPISRFDVTGWPTRFACQVP